MIKYDTTKGVMDFEKKLILKEYDEAFELLHTNPFIMSDNYFFIKIQEVWNDQFDQIANSIFSNDLNKAKNIFSKFENFCLCKKDYTDLINTRDKLFDIAIAIRNSDFNQIFNSLKDEPILYKTPIGKKVKRDWENALEVFTNYLLTQKFKENSKEFLVIKKYQKSLEKKILIDTLIKNQPILISCANAFKEKNFGLYTNILKKNPYLKKIPLIKKLNAYADTIYTKIEENLTNENFSEALKLFKIWFYFDETKEKAYLLEERIQTHQSFKNSFEKGNIDRCRAILEQHNQHFFNTKYFNILIKYDLEKIQNSLDFIHTYNLCEAYSLLQNYFKSKLWSQKLQYIMKSYYAKLFVSKYINENNPKKEIFIDKFYELFGEIDISFQDYINTNDYPRKITVKNITNYPKDLV